MSNIFRRTSDFFKHYNERHGSIDSTKSAPADPNQAVVESPQLEEPVAAPVESTSSMDTISSILYFNNTKTSEKGKIVTKRPGDGVLVARRMKKPRNSANLNSLRRIELNGPPQENTFKLDDEALVQGLGMKEAGKVKRECRLVLVGEQSGCV